MSRSGIAATLAGLVILSGCAGVHRRMGEPPVTEPWGASSPSPNATALKDPFTPQPRPSLGAGMARYFPGLSRMAASPEPVEISEPIPEITNERPRLGFRTLVPETANERPRLGSRLFRNWSRPEPVTIEPFGPRDPDQLVRREATKAARASEEVTQVSAFAESLPPRLPVAILAEVDPSILPAKGSALASRSEGQAPRHRQDDAARRVQARLDDVSEASIPRTSRPDPDGPANPFEGFDLPDSPWNSAPTSHREAPAMVHNEADDSGGSANPNPFEGFDLPGSPWSSAAVSSREASSATREEADSPGPVAAGVIRSASRPSDPFDGFEALLLPEDSGAGPGSDFGPMAAENISPHVPNASTRAAIEEPRERYGHTTLPLSRRYDPRPLPSEPKAEEESEPAGRPQLPLERPWQGQGPGASTMLPPVTFPAAYYDEKKPPSRSEPRSPDEARGRQRRFNWPHLFGRGATDDLDLARGSEADHVPEPR